MARNIISHSFHEVNIHRANEKFDNYLVYLGIITSRLSMGVSKPYIKLICSQVLCTTRLHTLWLVIPIHRCKVCILISFLYRHLHVPSFNVGIAARGVLKLRKGSEEMPELIPRKHCLLFFNLTASFMWER